MKNFLAAVAKSSLQPLHNYGMIYEIERSCLWCFFPNSYAKLILRQPLRLLFMCSRFYKSKNLNCIGAVFLQLEEALWFSVFLISERELRGVHKF